MTNKLKIAYLLDKNNSWIFEYLKNSKLFNSKKNINKFFFKANN